MGRLEVAAGILEDALPGCTTEPRIRRELAALRFRQGRYAEASQLAEAYLARAPGDSLGWQLLASARYLEGDRAGALEAWNRIGEPRVAGLHLVGPSATRQDRFAAAIAIPDSTVLSAAHLVLAGRRIAEMPTVNRSAVGYQALPSGEVQLHASVIEHPVLGTWWQVAGITTARALAAETVELELANPGGLGEQWQVEWRWEAARPRKGLRLSLPASPGVLALHLGWERIRVAVASGVEPILQSTWRDATVEYGWWSSPWLRPAFDVGMQLWDGDQKYFTMGTTTEMRSADDRLRLQLTGLHALSLADHGSYSGAGVRGFWASSFAFDQFTWSGRAGVDWVSAGAPLGVWPLVHGGLDRAIPLRAEPSISGAAMEGRATGRTVLHGGVGADHPVVAAGPLAFGVGVFLDGARVTHAADPGVRERDYLDAGFGVRVGLMGGAMGVVRMDLAWGLLSDRRSAITFGYHKEWPAWSRGSR